MRASEVDVQPWGNFVYFRDPDGNSWVVAGDGVPPQRLTHPRAGDATARRGRSPAGQESSRDNVGVLP
jgi:hypothetical protein